MKRVVVASLLAACLTTGFAIQAAADPPPPAVAAVPTPPPAAPLVKGKLPKTKSAHSHLTSGVIKAYDAKTRTLTLETGSKYVLGEEVGDPQFGPGDAVLLHWAMTNGQRLVAKASIKK